MKDPLEERLERLQPAPLPNDLMARLIVARPQPAEPPPLPKGLMPAWWWQLAEWTGALALLAVSVVLTVQVVKDTQARSLRARTAALASTLAPAPQPTRIFLPVEQRNILVSADDLGIIGADSPHPVRLVRTVWVDDATFRGTDGVSQARLTQPREQIIPVSLETY